MSLSELYFFADKIYKVCGRMKICCSKGTKKKKIYNLVDKQIQKLGVDKFAKNYIGKIYSFFGR